MVVLLRVMAITSWQNQGAPLLALAPQIPLIQHGIPLLGQAQTI
jgi:hypothetical protein